MPQLDGSQDRQLHAQPATGILGGVGLEFNSSLGLQDVALGQGQLYILWPYKETWSLARVKIIHMGRVNLS